MVNTAYPKAPEHLPLSLRHEVTVTAHPATGPAVPLEVSAEGSAVEVAFSEDWAPYAQVKVSLPAPTDAALLDDVLDPRRNVRLRIEAGYTYPDNSTETALLASVGLRERPLRRPADLLTLDGGSNEYRAQDYRALWFAGMERAGLNEAVSWLAGYAEPGAVVRSELPAKHGAAALADLEVQLGDDYWTVLAEAAVRTNARVWCDETGVWRIARRVDKAGAPVHRLAVGEGGTITETESNLTRDPWFNAVLLRYRWRTAAGDEREILGRAVTASGLFAVAAVGYKTHYEQLERPISQAAADAAAAAKLRTLLSRGRTRTLTAAAAYWLRPADTVTVALPTGAEEAHLVQSVSFTPLDGLMRVTTRQPLDVNITNGE